ncbi:LacI family DNA-binding transcriptional regulator [Streptomyces phaeochromogenes]|uniref:LacI family DNA-binding transcriptional regulator n=1 Tax=Streptomyces phaeochromogenes TaxID=1923 RepID=UPI0036B3028E
MSRTSSSPTLAQIARLAGVSVPTASRVANGRENVAPETRLRVEEVLRRTGYERRPRPARNGLAPLIDVVVPGLGGGWSAEVLRGAEREAAEAGFGVVVTSSRRDPPTGGGIPGRQRLGGRALDRLHAHGTVAALFALTELTPAQHLWLTGNRIPYVVVDPGTEPPLDVPSVTADNRGGGRRATEHLLNLGHRRIAVLAGHRRTPCSAARIDGYRQALRAVGLRPRPEFVRHAGFDAVRAEWLTGELLALPEPPTALFACSDEMAAGALRAATLRGLHVPGDLSVVGFDDLPEARRLLPQLTTVRQPIADMAADGVGLLARAMSGERGESLCAEHPTRLVVRGSTASPRT